MSDEPTLSTAAFGRAFLELLRRASLIAAEEGGDLVVGDRHVTEALDELIIAGETPGSQSGPEPPEFFVAEGPVPPMR